MQRAAKHYLVAIALAFVLGTVAYAALRNKTYKTDNANSLVTVSTEDGWITARTVNSRFDVEEVPFGDTFETISVRQTVRQERKFGMEGTRSSVDVELTAIPELTEHVKSWSLTTEGDTGQIVHPFYEVTKYGCCDEANSIQYFELTNGTRMYYSAVPIVEIDLVGNDPCCRYLAAGYKDRDYDHTFLQYGTSERVMTVFEISGAKEVVSSIFVAQAGRREKRSMVMVEHSRPFEIEVSFRNGLVLKFPINNSVLGLPTTIPAGVTVKQSK
jgi:hypothetical protein